MEIICELFLWLLVACFKEELYGRAGHVPRAAWSVWSHEPGQHLLHELCSTGLIISSIIHLFIINRIINLTWTDCTELCNNIKWIISNVVYFLFTPNIVFIWVEADTKQGNLRFIRKSVMFLHFFCLFCCVYIKRVYTRVNQKAILTGSIRHNNNN